MAEIEKPAGQPIQVPKPTREPVRTEPSPPIKTPVPV
jgi:hypothetical protein